MKTHARTWKTTNGGRISAEVPEDGSAEVDFTIEETYRDDRDVIRVEASGVGCLSPKDARKFASHILKLAEKAEKRMP